MGVVGFRMGTLLVSGLGHFFEGVLFGLWWRLVLWVGVFWFLSFFFSSGPGLHWILSDEAGSFGTLTGIG